MGCKSSEFELRHYYPSGGSSGGSVSAECEAAFSVPCLDQVPLSLTGGGTGPLPHSAPLTVSAALAPHSLRATQQQCIMGDMQIAWHLIICEILHSKPLRSAGA